MALIFDYVLKLTELLRTIYQMELVQQLLNFRHNYHEYSDLTPFPFFTA